MGKIVFAIILGLVLLAGCASLRDTIEGISTNPAGYVMESTASATATKEAVPELPYIFCVGIGYAASFLRRWWKNNKIAQAKKLIV